MRRFKFIVLIILALMSLAAGVAKVLQAPQEVAFFDSVGLSLGFLVPLGVLQIASAVLALVPRTRKGGLIAMALVFLASALMIFVDGKGVFGLISLVPVILAIILAYSQWDAEIRPPE